MQIKDSFTVEADTETVWNYLLDIERMSQCVPGMESIEAVDDKTYVGKLKVKVGPILASFSGRASITEVDPPNRLVADIEGNDKASDSAVKAAFTSTLVSIDEGTRVDYEIEVYLRGRLAQFGLTIVRGTAKKMTATFSTCVQKALTGEGPI
jgi:carbon monoxide dehydrogenase subunit G